MENSSADPSEAHSALLALALAWSFAGLLATLVARSRAERRVGKTLLEERGRSVLRYVALTLVAGAAAAVAVNWSELPGLLALFALLLIAAQILLVPSGEDRAFGERGVRCGWHAREFGELEEWRLTGEHLRWKLRGEWQACRVPRESFDGLRAELLAKCGARESTFKD